MASDGLSVSAHDVWPWRRFAAQPTSSRRCHLSPASGLDAWLPLLSHVRRLPLGSFFVSAPDSALWLPCALVPVQQATSSPECPLLTVSLVVSVSFVRARRPVVAPPRACARVRRPVVPPTSFLQYSHHFARPPGAPWQTVRSVWPPTRGRKRHFSILFFQTFSYFLSLSYLANHHRPTRERK